MIKKIDVDKLMDALMLRYWGIFSIDQTYRQTVKAANYFKVQNSILSIEEDALDADCDKTVLAIAVPYALEGTSKPKQNNMAKVEAFGWDFDYHVQIKRLLNEIQSGLEMLCGYPLSNVTLCVDTSPYSDREVGFYAGLGLVGHNHLLIHEQLGSNIFIGYLVIHQKLSIERSAQVMPEDLPETISHPHCQSCGRCTSACPTNVCGLQEADMTLCLSAQTQSKEILVESMRLAVHDRLYGCSVCQVVCPLNHNKMAHPLLTLKSENWLDALALLELTSQDFKQQYGHMGFTWRPLWIYKRNALIVLGNTGDSSAYEALVKRSDLRTDDKLADYYAWAITQIKNRLSI
jgi:epoxyqueuosine reductase